jgi:predicted acylesterase/phospholipase RssA
MTENSRDRHLFGRGPKRLLALDGGGVRGALTLAFLERIEMLLSERAGKDVLLGDYFDLVGGTSTGAVIAGAIALGRRTAEIKDFYQRLAPHAFKRQFWHIPVLQAKFDARGLRAQIEDIVGDRKLSSEDLITGLCVIAKRMDTGSPWILANNPKAPYWKDGIDRTGKQRLGNMHYKLASLVRASTAAPHYFDPEVISINRDDESDTLASHVASPLAQPLPLRFFRAVLEKCGLRKHFKFDSSKHGLFVDGGVSPHNNPSLALFQMVTVKPFGICWRMGPRNLSIISIGTGSHRPRLAFESLGFARFPKLAYHALMSLMTDAEVHVLAQMQWMGECPAPWIINSEVGTLADDYPLGAKMFRFLRYDVHLEREWLASELGIKCTDGAVERLRQMDDPTIVTELFDIGRIAAERQIKTEHLDGLITHAEPLAAENA